MQTTDGQTDGLMDQWFTLTWLLTTAFYEAVVATKFGEKTGGEHLPLLRPDWLCIFIRILIPFLSCACQGQRTKKRRKRTYNDKMASLITSLALLTMLILRRNFEKLKVEQIS